MKQNLLSFIGLLGLSLLLASCSNRSVLPSYYDHAPNHKLIAVLPVVIENDLKTDQNTWNQDELASITRSESEDFQDIVYRTILKKVGLRKYEIKISLQSLNVTNRRLEEFGISALDVENKDPVEMANILGVDAVVLVKIHKDILTGEFQNLDGDILASKEDVFLEDEEEEDFDESMENPIAVPKKYRVNLISELIDGRDGSLLWHFSKGKSPDMDYQLDKSVEDLSRSMVRKFPYKNFHKGFLEEAL